MTGTSNAAHSPRSVFAWPSLWGGETPAETETVGASSTNSCDRAGAAQVGDADGAPDPAPRTDAEMLPLPAPRVPHRQAPRHWPLPCAILQTPNILLSTHTHQKAGGMR